MITENFEVISYEFEDGILKVWKNSEIPVTNVLINASIIKNDDGSIILKGTKLKYIYWHPFCDNNISLEILHPSEIEEVEVTKRKWLIGKKYTTKVKKLKKSFTNYYRIKNPEKEMKVVYNGKYIMFNETLKTSD